MNGSGKNAPAHSHRVSNVHSTPLTSTGTSPGLHSLRSFRLGKLPVRRSFRYAPSTYPHITQSPAVGVLSLRDVLRLSMPPHVRRRSSYRIKAREAHAIFYHVNIVRSRRFFYLRVWGGMLKLHYSDVFFQSGRVTLAFPACAEVSTGRATSLIRAMISSHPTGGGSGLPHSLRSFASPSLGLGAPLLATLAGVPVVASLLGAPRPAQLKKRHTAR